MWYHDAARDLRDFLSLVLERDASGEYEVEGVTLGIMAGSVMPSNGCSINFADCVALNQALLASQVLFNTQTWMPSIFAERCRLGARESRERPRFASFSAARF